nr:hypothetical protein [Salmonella sp.]
MERAVKADLDMSFEFAKDMKVRVFCFPLWAKPKAAKGEQKTFR